ncbi:MAG TPA: hypothetical protein VMS38_20085, partial [Pseudorhodoferax sp.]|nr:hypothetical protein [Pseudorhodoferax sp.]
VIAERIKKLVNNDLEDASAQTCDEYQSALEVLMEVLFFLYSVAPSVGASYKLSTALILTHRFSQKNLPLSSQEISQKLYDLAADLLLDQCGKQNAEGIDGFVNLEYLNIALAIRELGELHLLPERVLYELFIKGRKLGYFTIISCLFYVRDNMQYKAIRRALIRIASSKIGNLSKVLSDSESAHLLLDLLTCPFVPEKKKIAWIQALHKSLSKAQPSSTDMAKYLAASASTHSQVDWSDIDLLNSLEKKELKQAY